MGLETATRVQVSRAVGAGNLPLANHVALNNLLLLGSVSFTVASLAAIYTEYLLYFLGVSDAVVAQTATGSSRLHLNFRDFRFDPHLLWRTIRIGAPSSVTSMERSLANLIVVGLVASFGELTLAAYSVTQRVQQFVNMGSQGMGQSAGILVGQNLRAQQPKRARATVWWALGYVMLLSGVAVDWSVLGWQVPMPTIGNLGQFGIAWAIVLAVAARLVFYFPYFLWGPWHRRRVF